METSSQRSFVNSGLILWWWVLGIDDSILLSIQPLSFLPNMQILVLSYMAVLIVHFYASNKCQGNHTLRIAMLDLLPSQASHTKCRRGPNVFPCLDISRGLCMYSFTLGFCKPQRTVQIWECSVFCPNKKIHSQKGLVMLPGGSNIKDMLKVMSSVVCIIWLLKPPLVLALQSTLPREWALE